jgi:hypothetical protein
LRFLLWGILHKVWARGQISSFFGSQFIAGHSCEWRQCPLTCPKSLCHFSRTIVYFAMHSWHIGCEARSKCCVEVRRMNNVA